MVSLRSPLRPPWSCWSLQQAGPDRINRNSGHDCDQLTINWPILQDGSESTRFKEGVTVPLTSGTGTQFDRDAVITDLIWTRWEKKVENWLALIHFANALIAW